MQVEGYYAIQLTKDARVDSVGSWRSVDLIKVYGPPQEAGPCIPCLIMHPLAFHSFSWSLWYHCNSEKLPKFTFSSCNWWFCPTLFHCLESAGAVLLFESCASFQQILFWYIASTGLTSSNFYCILSFTNFYTLLAKLAAVLFVYLACQ